MKKVLALMLLAVVANATDFSSVVNENEPKVVKIGIVIGNGSGGTCSGSFITSTGLILTCAHCFTHGKTKKLFIKDYKEVVYKGAILFVDTKRDLAIVATDSIGPFDYFAIGDEPKIGQQVFSFGSPLGIQHTFTVGWVSNIVQQGRRILFHSAFINPGNSGGPVVDSHDKLVGINQFTIPYGFFQTAAGLYGAINVTEVREFLKEVKIKPRVF